MEIIQPVGTKLIVKPIEMKKHVTKAGLQVESIDLREAVVVGIGTDMKDIYKPGDRILYPRGAGVGQLYKGEAHFWLDGRGTNNNGDVWGVISDEVPKKDKGDSL